MLFLRQRGGAAACVRSLAPEEGCGCKNVTEERSRRSSGLIIKRFCFTGILLPVLHLQAKHTSTTVKTEVLTLALPDSGLQSKSLHRGGLASTARKGASSRPFRTCMRHQNIVLSSWFCMNTAV